MTMHLTNANLTSILNDIDHWMRTSPAWTIFMGSKVKRFNEQNQLRINSLKKDFATLIDKHVMKDEKGNPEMMAFQNTSKFRFKSDEDEKAYEEAYKALMDKSFDVYL